MLLKGNRKIMLLLLLFSSIEALSQDYFLKVDKVNPVFYLMNKKSGVRLDSIEHASSLQGFSCGISGNSLVTISEMIGSNHRSLFYLNYYEVRDNKFLPVGHIAVLEDDKKVSTGLTLKIMDSILLLSYSFADKEIYKSYPLNTQLLKRFKANYDLFRREVIETDGIMLERKSPSRL